MIGVYERPSEHSDKSTNRTAIDLGNIVMAEIFVFVNKETQKKGKALKLHFNTVVKVENGKEERAITLFANNKGESDQLEDIFEGWLKLKGTIDYFKNEEKK